MPELPEVETTCRGISPYITDHEVTDVVGRQPLLRWPVRSDLADLLIGKKLEQVSRRAKYLLFTFPHGTLMGHLGMSGSLRVLPAGTPAEKHDHVDITFDNGQMLRLTDPRRFGAMVWSIQPPEHHELLNKLGPEPLSEDFTGELLFKRSRKRKHR